MKVSVIIPTLNEGRSIGLTIDQIPKDFANLEIVIVDGLSKDDTVEVAHNKSARVVLETRKGYGRAYKSGFASARGDIIVTMDGDTTYPAEEIPALVKMLLDEDLDFITCDRITRMEKDAMTTTHKFGNWVLKVGTNVLFGMSLKDSQSGMWVFRKKILERIHPVSDGMAFSEEIKIEAFKNKDLKTKEVSVPYRPRIGEIKLNTWGDGMKNLTFLMKKKTGKVEPTYKEEEGKGKADISGKGTEDKCGKGTADSSSKGTDGMSGKHVAQSATLPSAVAFGKGTADKSGEGEKKTEEKKEAPKTEEKKDTPKAEETPKKEEKKPEAEKPKEETKK